MKTTDEKRFDDSIRNKLNQKEEEVPAYVWQSVSENLAKRKMFWLFSGLNSFFFHDLLLLAGLTLLGSYDVAVSGSVTDAIHKIKNAVVVAEVKEDVALQHSDHHNVADRPEKKDNAFAGENISAKEKEENGSINVTAINKKKGNNKSNNKTQRLTHAPVQQAEEAMLAQFIPAADDAKYNDMQRELSKMEAPRYSLTEGDLTEEEMKTVEVLAAGEMSRPLSVRIAAGIIYFDGNISSDNGTTVKDESEKINRTAFSILLDYPVARKWNVLFGINQNVSVLKWNISDQHTEEVTVVDSMIGYIISPFDPPVPYTIYDTNTVAVTSVKDYPSTFTLTSIDLILQAERAFQLSVINCRLSGGLLFNVSNKAEGNVPDLSDADADQPASKVIKSSAGFGFAAGAEAGYCTGRIEPFVRVQYEKYFDSVTEMNYPVQSIPERIKIMAGLRIRFTK